MISIDLDIDSSSDILKIDFDVGGSTELMGITNDNSLLFYTELKKKEPRLTAYAIHVVAHMPRTASCESKRYSYDILNSM